MGRLPDCHGLHTNAVPRAGGSARRSWSTLPRRLGARLGHVAIRIAAVNRRAVEFLRALRSAGPAFPSSMSSTVIGPRGDSYVIGETVSVCEAAAYHVCRHAAFAEAGAAMSTAVTMTYVARGARRGPSCQLGRSPVMPFTVEAK